MIDILLTSRLPSRALLVNQWQDNKEKTDFQANYLQISQKTNKLAFNFTFSDLWVSPGNSKLKKHGFALLLPRRC